MIVASLKNNPNLQHLAQFSEEQLEQLVKVAWKEVVESGREIMTEGDLNNAKFFIIAEGTFEVVASGPFEVVTHSGMSYLSRPEQVPEPTSKKTVRRVGRCGSFGDSSMLYDTPRWGTATALERAVVWVISHSNFKVIQQLSAQGPSTEKSPEDEQMLANALRANANLQRLTPLNHEHVKGLVKIAWQKVLSPGHTLMHEGDLNADAFYIVGSGLLEFVGSEPFEVQTIGDVSHLSRAAHSGQALSPNSRSVTTRTCGRGLCFGEITMLYCAPRFATVKALEKSVVWAIDRSNFQMIQMKAAEDEIRDRMRHLNNLAVMKSWPQDDKEKMAVVMETMRLKKDEVLSREGEDDTILYILCQGSVQTLVGGQERGILEADHADSVVHYFWEDALTGAKASPATVQVVSDTATALILEREEFMKVWDRLLEATPSPAFERYTTTVSKVGHPSDELTLGSLVKIGLLGVGALGPLELHKHGSKKDLYVLKSMDKGLIAQKGLRKSVMRERMLWMEVISPFIVRVFATFRTPQTLSFLLEAALGGELADAYGSKKLHGSKEHAMYYVAGTVLALEHLHKRKIIFRNIKPQNVLLSHLGHVKLTDMSLAKRLVGHTFTTCGTPTYMAPEIVAGTGHTRAVDWWSVGVFTFWLMAGWSPFESNHPMEIYSKVMRGIARVSWPDACAGPVGDLIGSLLQPLGIDRLAMRQGGIQNVINHPWFSGFDWEAMRKGNMEPPYKPTWDIPPRRWKDTEVSSSIYLSHFAAYAEDLPKPVEYFDDGSEWDEDFAIH